MKKTCLALFLVLVMLSGIAAAENISFSGTVEPSETCQVYAPVSGTVDAVPVREGQEVTADTVIARIRTTKVYAPEDGTVTAVFGEPGDAAETVAERYGAIMYLEGKYTLTISASTSRAYDAKENFIIHAGETVYLVSRNRNTNKGQGIVTTVDGSSYTVLVTEGEFFMNDSMDIMRSDTYAATSRIGRGSIARVSPTAITGTGSIVSFAVQPGDTVKRGQLLFETVEGSFDGLEMTGTEIRAGTDGVVASLSVAQGDAVTEDAVVAEIYPKDSIRVKADVAETDLKELSVGQKVKVELDWNQDQGISYEGTVEMISGLGTVGEESTTYPVYIAFTPDANTRYSMTALVTTLDGEGKASRTEETDGELEVTESEDSGKPSGKKNRK